MNHDRFCVMVSSLSYSSVMTEFIYKKHCINYIIRVLEEENSIKSNNISHCQLTDEDIIQILPSLINNRSISRISLNNNNISIKGINLLIGVLKENCNITYLSLDLLNSKRKKEVKKYLSRNKHNQDQKSANLFSILFSKYYFNIKN